jgi:hypothetical protein
MNLYLVKRTDGIGYDEYDAMIVAARNENEARTVDPAEWGWGCGVDSATLEVQRIGTAARGTANRTVILSSFNAG